MTEAQNAWKKQQKDTSQGDKPELIKNQGSVEQGRGKGKAALKRSQEGLVGT